ncbi:MAG TPA: dihydrofolate reductase family protein [Thermoleophilaceae bacterium]
MAKLVYQMGTSLDGYVEDASGSIDWSVPPEDVHRIANENARAASGFLFGRGLYEMMEPYWPDLAADPGDAHEIEAEFAREYVATPRIVFSDSLESVGEGVTLLPRAQARPEIERLKSESDGAFDIAGPTLAASVFDLIDEFRTWMNPVALGGGKPYFPQGAGQLDLRLVESRPCSGGVLYLRYERAG